MPAGSEQCTHHHNVTPLPITLHHPSPPNLAPKPLPHPRHPPCRSRWLGMIDRQANWMIDAFYFIKMPAEFLHAVKTSCEPRESRRTEERYRRMVIETENRKRVEGGNKSGEREEGDGNVRKRELKRGIASIERMERKVQVERGSERRGEGADEEREQGAERRRCAAGREGGGRGNSRIINCGLKTR